MAEDLVEFVRQMDACWIEGRFANLSSYLADDVVFVAPGGKQRLEGREAAIESYREFMSRCEVSSFRPFDHLVTNRDPAAVVEYGWEMAWRDQGQEHQAAGREVLVLARRRTEWRVVWRTQPAA